MRPRCVECHRPRLVSYGERCPVCRRRRVNERRRAARIDWRLAELDAQARAKRWRGSIAPRKVTV